MDPIKQPPASDMSAFKIASGLASQNNQPQDVIPVPSGLIDEGAFQHQLADGVKSVLEGAGLRKEEFTPSFSQTVGSAFRTGNLIANFASQSQASGTGAPLTSSDIISRAQKDGLGGYLSSFGTVTTEDEYASTAANIRQQLEDQRVMSASGISGAALALMAGFVDPTNYVLPGSRVATSLAAGRNVAARVAAGAAAGGVDNLLIHEAFNALDPIKSDGAWDAISTGTILGGILGFHARPVIGDEAFTKATDRLAAARADAAGFSSVPPPPADGYVRVFHGRPEGGNDPSAGGGRWVTPDYQYAKDYRGASSAVFYADIPESSPLLKKAFDDTGTDQKAPYTAFELPEELAKSMKPYSVEQRDPYAQTKSVGAAVVDRYRQETGRLNAMGSFGIFEKLGQVPVLGNYLRIPRLDLENSPFPSAREAINTLLGTVNPRLDKTDTHTAREVGSVSTDFAVLKGDFAQAIHESLDIFQDAKKNGAYTRFEDFNSDVAREMANYRPGQSAEARATWTPAQKAAAIFHDRVVDPIRKMHIENGTFDENLTAPHGAFSYFPMVHNVEKIQNDQEAFKAYHVDRYNEELKDAADRAHALRNANKTDRNTVKISEGQFKDRTLAQIKAEHDANLSAVRETRSQELAKHDQQAQADVASLKAARDAGLDVVKRNFDAERKDLRDTFSEMLQGDLEKKDKQQLRVSFERDLRKVDRQEASAVAKETKKHEAAIAKKQEQLKAKRKSLTNEQQSGKLDKLEAKTREVRDQAVSEAEAAAEASLKAELDKLNLPEGVAKSLEYRDPAKRDARARELADNYYAKTTGQTKFILDHEIATGTRGYEKFRSSPAWQAHLMERGWAKSQSFDIMEHYVSASGMDASIGRYFKKEDGKVKTADGKSEPKMVGDHSLSAIKKRVVTDAQDEIDVVKPSRKASAKIEAEFEKATKEVDKKYGTGPKFEAPKEPIKKTIDLDAKYIEKNTGFPMKSGVGGMKNPAEGHGRTELNGFKLDGNDVRVIKRGEREVGLWMRGSDLRGKRPAEDLSRPWITRSYDEAGAEWFKIGSAMAQTTKTKGTFLEHFAVRPEMQRRGLGSRLISLAEEHLNANPFTGGEFSGAGASTVDKFREARLASGTDRVAALATAQTAREAALNVARGDAERKILQDRDRTLNSLETIIHLARGTSPASGTSKALQRTMENIGMLNSLRLMGGVVVSSLGDTVNIGLANGFGKAVSYGLVPMIREFGTAMKSANGDLRRLSRMALVNAEAEFGSRVAELAHIPSIFEETSPGNKFLRNMTTQFFKYNGLQYWTSFNKQVSYNTMQARIIENAQKGHANLSAGERTVMNSLGLGDEMLAKIQTAYETQEGSKIEAGIPIARWDSWADKSTGDAMRKALYSEGLNQVITPHFSDKMALAANPIAKAFNQFRTFMIANQMRLIGRNLQAASIDNTTAMTVYSGLFGLVMMGGLIDAMKGVMANSTLAGSLSDRESAVEKIAREWKENPGKALYNALDRGGIFGPAFEGSRIAENLGLPGFKTGISHVLRDKNPSAPSSRGSQQGVGEALLGPSFGLANDAINAVKHAVNFGGYELGLKSKLDYARGDFRKDMRLLPGSTHPFIQPIIKTGEKSLGNIFHWPDPK